MGKKRKTAQEKLVCFADLSSSASRNFGLSSSRDSHGHDQMCTRVKLPKNNYSNQEFTSKTVDSVDIRQPVRLTDLQNSDILAIDDFGQPLFLNLSTNKLMVKKEEGRQS